MHICFKPVFGRNVRRTRFQMGIHQGTLEMLPMYFRRKICRAINLLKRGEELTFHLEHDRVMVYITDVIGGDKKHLGLQALDTAWGMISVIPQLANHLYGYACIPIIKFNPSDIIVHVR